MEKKKTYHRIEDENGKLIGKLPIKTPRDWREDTNKKEKSLMVMQWETLGRVKR